jgi:Methyltransferase FkbM domain
MFFQAFVFGGCLSPTNRPGQLLFKSADGLGGPVNHLTKSLENFIVRSKNFEAVNPVQCFPLSDILAALGVKRVDFLSLDVHGAELDILKTLDFNELRIDILAVEVYDESAILKRTVMAQFHDFMNRTGVYRLVREFKYDMIFKRIDV